MQVIETKSEGLKREFKVSVPATTIEENLNSRLKEVAKSAALPGFRPGKVPESLLRKKYGSSLMGEVLEQTVNSSAMQVLSDKEMRPALQPNVNISSFEEGGDLEFTLAVEIFPEIKPVPFSDIKLERLKVAADDKDVEAAIQKIAEGLRATETLKESRPAENGDIAVIDFVGKVNGEEFPGGKADGYPLTLGSGSFIPGFEEQIVGASVGGKLEVKVAFPEDYGAENLAGKDAVFDVEIKELQVAIPAPIDDELAKKMGTENLDALKTKIREDHEKEYNSMARMRLKRVLLDKLSEVHEFELPEGMVGNEYEAIWNQLEQEKKTHPEDEELQKTSRDDKKQAAEFRQIAERRVQLGLLLAEIGRQNNIDLGNEDMSRALQVEAGKYPGQEQAVLDHYRNNPEAMEALRAPVYEEKVVDFILELVDINDREATLEELIADPDEEPAKKAAAKSKKAGKSGSDKKPAKKGKPAKPSAKNK